MSDDVRLSRGARVRPWVALLVPPSTWYLFELGLGSVLKVNCQPVGDWMGLIWGVVSLAACCGAMVLVGRSALVPAGDQTGSRVWLSRVALILGGIFALAIAFQTLSVLIVPPCAG
jgi:hypothetical protein